MEKKRILYPDIVKAIAIFIVTCSHAAQNISGVTWTNFLGGGTIDIAFHMPLFMLISGWFINPEKMRNESIVKYVIAKFKRLIIPAYTWFVICYVAGFTMHPIVSFWYLKALFVCLCIIVVSVRIIKNDILCAIITSIIVLICPRMETVNINFMFPFLWAGYFLHKYLDNGRHQWLFLTCLVLSIVLLLFWTKEKSVYWCPLKVHEVSIQMLLTYFYRFTIGFSISTVIIYLVKNYESNKTLASLVPVGQHSLVIYTSSNFFNGVISETLNYFGYHTNQYVLLDVLSILYSFIVVYLAILIVKWCKKNKYAKLLVLGE